MTEQGGHPGEALQLLLDDRLPRERRAEVEEHLRGCARCRREVEALRLVKTGVRDALPQHAVPPALAARVSAALVKEAKRAIGFRWAAVVALPLAAAALFVLLLLRPWGEGPDFVTAAASDFIAYRAAQLALPMETGDPAVLERAFTTSGLPFRPRVFDFAMMDFRLRGGAVHRIAGRVSALFAYVGSRGDRVVCQMYQGTTSELPAGAEEREHDGIRFRIYRSAGVTLVFWQEGSLVCVMAADGDPEQVIQLAYAKAIKV